MTCKHIQDQFDDYLDHTLQPEACHHLDEHLKGCAVCQDELKAHQSLLQELGHLPVPPASQGLYARVMREGRKQHSATQPIRLRAAGGLLGICLVAVLSFTLWPQGKNNTPALQAINLQVFETKAITLAFNAPNDMDNVQFTLQLPEGIELEGHPARTQLAWTDQLRKGRNVMNLKLKGTSNLQGELVARIEHKGLKREFKLPLKVMGMDGADISLPLNVDNLS